MSSLAAMESTEGSTMLPQQAASQESRKRKRPRVPLEQRQRASIACASCRRLKEKCDGIIPCSRCQRYKRECVAVIQSASIESRLPGDERNPSIDRVQDLEFVARHYLGSAQLSDDDLRNVVLGLETGASASDSNFNNQPRSQEEDELTLDQEHFTVKTLSSSVAHYSGELSHWNFSQRVRAQADKRLKRAAPTRIQSASETTVLEYWRAHHLQSRSTAFRKLRASLPPKHVAHFLATVYFQHAQINTFFVEKAWLFTKLDVIYGTSEHLCSDDAAWLCTTLGVLAVGTEFVHMQEFSTNPTLSDDSSRSAAAAVAAGVSFYKLAAELIPDVITIASVESVQAFLALAHYALPLDAQGLAYTFLGLALKMAIQNGMHRKYSGDLSPELVDLRNRLWWTAYRLEKRVSILHGRPASISSSEIDAEYPVDAVEGTNTGRVLENAMTKITDWLGDIAVIIHMLRRSPKRLRRAYFERVMQVRRQYVQWWQGSNIPAPTTSSRAVAHIHMSHHLNLIFLGRPFMFQTQGSAHAGKSAGANSFHDQIAELVQDAVNSAEQIVKTASQLHVGAGLARSSYMEFSSCRAAMLVLLAQCLHGPDRRLRAKLTEGMKLIKHMAPANASTESEASLMTAIEAAVQQLDSREEPCASNEVEGTQDSFSSFMRWATGYQAHTGDCPSAIVADDGSAMAAARICEINETFAENGWSPFDVSIMDGESDGPPGLDFHHFEDAFSIANTGGNELFGEPSTWQ